MSDTPHDDLVPVRYVGGQPRIINGATVSDGDVVSLPATEVQAWPQDVPHPYYERVSSSSGDAAPPAHEHEQAPPRSAPEG